MILLNTNKKFSQASLENFRQLLSAVKNRKIAVLGHMRPDGDCISSQLAMAWLLREFGASEVVCINKHEVPYLYNEILNGEKFYLADDFDVSTYDIITVDCADYARTSEVVKARKSEVFACIDHHVTNAPYAKINILEPTSCATAALIASLLEAEKIDFPKEIATALYVGVMMDTRQLTTSNTDLNAFEISTFLVSKGASPAEVSIMLYQREKFAKMKLLAHFLQSLTMHFDDRVCIGFLPLGVYAKTGARKEDSDGLVDYARNIDGVEIALVIEILDNGGVKGSLRSKKPEMKVNEIAKHFGGGGHFAAAGFSLNEIGFDEFYPQFLKYVEGHLRSYDAGTL